MGKICTTCKITTPASDDLILVCPTTHMHLLPECMAFSSVTINAINELGINATVSAILCGKQ